MLKKIFCSVLRANFCPSKSTKGAEKSAPPETGKMPKRIGINIIRRDEDTIFRSEFTRSSEPRELAYILFKMEIDTRFSTSSTV